MSDAYVRVEDLKVSFPTEDGLVRAVDGVSFSVERGQTIAIVGRVRLGQERDVPGAHGPGEQAERSRRGPRLHR